jgi:hypothetical protein
MRQIWERFKPGAHPEKATIGNGRSPAPGQVDIADPVLQRCLNRLQILGAVAGQLDRHRKPPLRPRRKERTPWARAKPAALA